MNNNEIERLKLVLMLISWNRKQLELMRWWIWVQDQNEFGIS